MGASSYTTARLAVLGGSMLKIQLDETDKEMLFDILAEGVKVLLATAICTAVWDYMVSDSVLHSITFWQGLGITIIARTLGGLR